MEQDLNFCGSIAIDDLSVLHRMVPLYLLELLAGSEVLTRQSSSQGIPAAYIG